MPATAPLNPIAIQAAVAAIKERNQSQRQDTLVDRLHANDASLEHLKLVRKPGRNFNIQRDDDVMRDFIAALEVNTTVKTVQLSWIFLSALTAEKRIQLMTALGGLVSLEKLIMEAIGPCEALVAALQQARNLKTLWIGALRISSNADCQMLATALANQTTLQQVTLHSIRLKRLGSHRVDEEGMVWFQENEDIDHTIMDKIDINPLLAAIAKIPTLEKIMLDLQLDPTKMQRVQKNVLKLICQAPRTWVMLNNCDLDDKDIMTISKELASERQCLELLNLGLGNRIGPLGWEALAEMLQTNYDLIRLYTPNPLFQEQPTTTNEYLVQRTNEFLARRFPAQYGNRVAVKAVMAPSDECRQRMGHFIHLNQKGRKKLLCNANTPRNDWIEFLAPEATSIDMVFLILLMAPDLFSN